MSPRVRIGGDAFVLIVVARRQEFSVRSPPLIYFVLATQTRISYQEMFRSPILPHRATRTPFVSFGKSPRFPLSL